MEINRSECEGYCDWLDPWMEITAGEGLNINMLELIRHHLLEVEDEMDIIDSPPLAGGNDPSFIIFTIILPHSHLGLYPRHHYGHRHCQWLRTQRE